MWTERAQCVSYSCRGKAKPCIEHDCGTDHGIFDVATTDAEVGKEGGEDSSNEDPFTPGKDTGSGSGRRGGVRRAISCGRMRHCDFLWCVQCGADGIQKGVNANITTLAESASSGLKL